MCSGCHPGSHVPFSYYASLISFSLEPYLSLSWFWHFWRSILARLFCTMSLILGASGFHKTKIRLCIFWQEYYSYTVSSMLYIKRHMVLTWSIPGDSSFDHLVKAAARILYCKVTIYPFVMNNYLVGDTLRLLISCFSSYFTY